MTKKFYSLRFKMFLLTISTSLFCLILYLLMIYTFNSVIKNYYMNPNAVKARDLNIYNEFREFVNLKHIKTTDKKAIQEWVQQNGPLYLEVGNEKQWYEYGYYEFSKDFKNQAPDETASSYFRLDFSDMSCDIFISDFSQVTVRDTCQTIALVTVFAIFSLVMFWDSGQKMKKIRIISNGVKIIEQTGSTPVIPIRSNDELGYLSYGIQSMSQSLIQKNILEEEAFKANYDLITTMSHDLRTPLTVLLGCLDLMQDYQNLPAEQVSQYLALSVEKARQIKTLSNDLFQYFLVFTNEELHIQLKKCTVEELIRCCLSDFFYLLQNEGFQLELALCEEGTCMLDFNYFQRIVDNLASNLIKYADSEIPLQIQLTNTDYLRLAITNQIRKKSTIESNQIGLKTCRKIMDRIGGKFVTRKTDSSFFIEIEFPQYQDL